MKWHTVAAVLSAAALGLAAGSWFAAQVPASSVDGRLNDGQVSALDHGEALAYATEVMSSSGADGVWFDRHLSEVLPNQKYSVDGGPPAPWMAGVFHGRVTNVEAAAGYIDEYEVNGLSQTEVAFDDSSASWRLIVVTLSIDDDFDPGREALESIQLAVTFGGRADAKAMMHAFESQELLVAVHGPGASPLDDSLYAAGHAGALIGFVAEDGSVSMPFLDEDVPMYLRGLESLDAIAAEAAKDKPVIDLTHEGGIYVPVK